MDPGRPTETGSQAGSMEDQQQSRSQQLKKVFQEYGAVGVSLHIGIPLVSLGIFYTVVSSYPVQVPQDLDMLLRAIYFGSIILLALAARLSRRMETPRRMAMHVLQRPVHPHPLHPLVGCHYSGRGCRKSAAARSPDVAAWYRGAMRLSLSC